MPSIGVACNFYNEANALPGWLEMAASVFDDVVLVNAGPGGARSDDGSIELVEKWGARLVFDTIDEGFGVLRSKLIRLTSTDWTMILDADERFHMWAPVLGMASNGVPTIEGTYNQLAELRAICADPRIDAVVTSRRHWNNFHWDKPCQDFTQIPDWQARIVRNCEHVVYRADVRMHEQLIDVRTGKCPSWYHAGASHPWGPTGQTRVFHDHYHNWFKPMEPEQRAHDVRIYDALEAREAVPAA